MNDSHRRGNCAPGRREWSKDVAHGSSKNKIYNRVASWSFHTSKITCVSWHEDNNLLSTGSIDQSIFTWNVNSPNERVQKQNSHKDGVNGVAWGHKLASVGADGAFRLW